MEPAGRIESQGAVEQNLPRRRLEQILTAHDFGDLHGRVIGDAGKLITWHAVAPPDHKVAKVHTRHKALRAEIQIYKFDCFAVGDAETPVEVARLDELARGGIGRHGDDSGAACAGIDGFVVERIYISVTWLATALQMIFIRRKILMRRAERGFQVLARTATREEKAAPEQLSTCVQIEGLATALLVGSKRPAKVWAFLPANSQPAQVFECGVGVLGAAAVRVQVFHAHDQRAGGG